MEQKFRHMEHKSLVALLLVITRIIKADSRIDADEIEQLAVLERQYGFDYTLMQEASRLTLAEAVEQLRTLDKPMRMQILKSMKELASTDRILERHEALLLLTLQYCLLEERPKCDVVSSVVGHRSGDLGTYIIYFENERDELCHQQIAEDWELLRLLLQQQGHQFFLVEQIVQNLCKQDSAIVKKLLQYLAPAIGEGQLEGLYQKMKRMDTATFAQQILIKQMQLQGLRKTAPSLLINLGSMDFLRIEIEDRPLNHIRKFLNDYTQLASPVTPTLRPNEDANNAGHFRYYSYFRDFFNLLVQSEPKESRLVIWPNKSEFEFPGIGKRLKLNQQEASLLTTILYYTYYSKGVPTCYDKETKAVESLYRTIYCRKKFIETDDVIYPENLAPIRAKIEKKMRLQLEGLDNLEDFIPCNEDRKGYYRIAAPRKMVTVKPDIRLEEVDILDFKW